MDGGSWRISNNGGTEPVWGVWGENGGELFYRGDDDALMVVNIETQPTFSVENTNRLFTGNYTSSNPPTYDVSPDGQRFLLMKETEDAPVAPQQVYAIVVENWFEELKRLAPSSR